MSQPTNGPAQNYPFQQGPAPASYPGVATGNAPVWPVGAQQGAAPSRGFAPGGYPNQVYSQGYAPWPQGPAAMRINWMSIICGIIGWVIIALTVVAMWVSIHSESVMADPSGADIIGFYPLFALGALGPANMIGGIMALVRISERPKTWRLNWLGLSLNASPWVILFVVVPLVSLFFVLFG